MHDRSTGVPSPAPATPGRPRPRLALAALALAAPAVLGAAGGEARPPAEQARFFEAKVRPVLVERCQSCHGADRQRGGLRLDSREALLLGGDSGPAVEPGNPGESLLIEAVRREGLEMPPKGALPEAEVEALAEWVAQGAPWPDLGEAGGGGATGLAATRRAPRGVITDEDRQWWSFRPVADPPLPAPDPGDEAAARNPVDAFLRDRLRAEGLSPAPEADRRALIRRLTFDLHGLPPTPEEVDAFLADEAPDAHERLVDRLLASPRYGERQARQWLDLVRYAESDGYRADFYRPQAWHYRDYVIRSLNDDKPYDRFVREQLAGDELYPGDPEALVATGYLRNGIYEYNNRDARGQWEIILDDITDTTGDVFLGLGLQCARCHDHKFDPILQKDYYRLRAFFAAIRPRDDLPAATPETLASHREAMAAWDGKTADLRRQIAEIEAPYRPSAAEDGISKFPEDIQALLRGPKEGLSPLDFQLYELAYRQVDYEYSRLDAKIKGDEKDRLLALRKELAATLKGCPEPPPTPPVVTDVGPAAPPVTIPRRGGEPIEPGVPSVLDPAPADVSPRPDSTGRRAALAEWLTRPDNPLTARVIVNRVWQQHFGRGLAASASDLGRLGEEPSHPELLDWLARRFVDDGWSLKRLHRRIVTSAAYRQSTYHPEADACRRVDPENRLLWRGTTRRLEAEQIRDALLAVSGRLDPAAGGPSVNPTEPRRTIYAKALRNVRDPLLEVFDLPLAFGSVSSRDTTTTPIQSLLLINSQAMLGHAAAFAGRLEREAGPEPSAMVERAYRLAFGRAPEPDESAAAVAFLADQRRRVDPERAGEAEAAFRHGKIPHRDGRAAIVTPEGDEPKLQVAHDDRLGPGDFTVEAYFVLRSVDAGSAVRTLAAKWDGDLARPGWAFGVTGKESRRRPQTLVLQLVGDRREGAGLGEAAAFSDHPVQLDRPYYAAASVRLATAERAGSVTFYLKDLSNDDEPLLVAEVPHGVVGGTGNDLPLTLGARSGPVPVPFDGLLDDVRYSAAVLGPEALLYAADDAPRDAMAFWRFEPEPGVFVDSTGNGLDLRPADLPPADVDPDRAALADFCHALLNASEFLYVD